MAVWPVRNETQTRPKIHSSATLSANLACRLACSGEPRKRSMYKITTGIHIHFAHHIRGHAGPCVSIHGHTWKFEVSLVSEDLDAQGFVVDFDDLDARVLTPCHRLLDHSLA